MSSKNNSLFKSHGVEKGDQVPLYVTNKQVQKLPKRQKSASEQVHDTLSLDDKIKAKKGKLNKPKRVV